MELAALHGAVASARRYDPALDAFPVANDMRPVRAHAWSTVMSNYFFSGEPAMDAFLIPGGFRAAKRHATGSCPGSSARCRKRGIRHGDRLPPPREGKLRRENRLRGRGSDGVAATYEAYRDEVEAVLG